MYCSENVTQNIKQRLSQFWSMTSNMNCKTLASHTCMIVRVFEGMCVFNTYNLILTARVLILGVEHLQRMT